MRRRVGVCSCSWRRFQPRSNQVRQTQAALTSEQRGKLLLGVVGCAIAGGVSTGSQPAVPTFAFRAEDLSDQECFKLLGCIVHFGRIVGCPHGGRDTSRSPYGTNREFCQSNHL